MPDIAGWTLFGTIILVMLVVDLAVAHRTPHDVSLREATVWSAVWIALALVFGAGIWWYRGPEAGLEYLTGYTLEKALSVDNLFVFAVLFTSFGVPRAQQHRLLFWGVVGALVLRGLLIAAGVTLIARFHWVSFLFGGLLVATGLGLVGRHDRAVDPTRHPVLRLLRRVAPALATRPLVVVLVLIETTDVIFALDSIPAVFAITQDPFILYTSNIFAILGLRSLYFLLAGVIPRFQYLKPGLAAVLVFVGGKMLVADFWTVPVALSLAVIATALGGAIGASLLFPRREAPRVQSHPGGL